jgi:hypothetical protein
MHLAERQIERMQPGRILMEQMPQVFSRLMNGGEGEQHL